MNYYASDHSFSIMGSFPTSGDDPHPITEGVRNVQASGEAASFTPHEDKG